MESFTVLMECWLGSALTVIPEWYHLQGCMYWENFSRKKRWYKCSQRRSVVRCELVDRLFSAKIFKVWHGNFLTNLLPFFVSLSCLPVVLRCGASLQHLSHPQCHPALYGRSVYSCQRVLQVTPQHYPQCRDLLCVFRWVECPQRERDGSSPQTRKMRCVIAGWHL